MLKVFITILFLQLSLFSHSLVFDAIDNEDGTMEVMGMFSTGVSAEGATLKIVSIATSKTIYQKRIPASGSLIVEIPKQAYKMILDSGPGHRIEKDGDIEPINGFNKIIAKKINYALYTTLVLSIVFAVSAFILHFIRIKRVSSS